MVVSGLGAVSATADAPVKWEQSSPDKVKNEVLKQIEDKGETDFWVRFADRPEMSQFESMGDWDARGQAVYDALTSTADASQKEVRQQLDADGVTYTSFWATNAIRIDSGDKALVNSLAANAEVEGIYPTRKIEAPVLEPATEPVISPTAVEWGIADIKADQVWETYGDTGEGMVIANIDTGVQYDHPALVNQYRGNNGDGTFDHDYNWFDPQGGSATPTDYDGHGTHTMGTMVGDDGGGNQIGVAPGAKWIAAAGCCPTDEALISSGQWMLAPTKVDGTAPDPSKRPNIVNNSWGTTIPTNDPFMEDEIEAWIAAGIFPVFSNGNSGPACNTSGSPGSRIITYSVGNYQANHTISSLSSRGAGQDGEIKPNISAPGTAVRSSVPGNAYALYSGTSMAAPHVAGAIALAWAAAPGLSGDIEGTRELLDGTAIDTPNNQCGGTDDDNNVFGEGRLDALALLQAAPIGDAGTLEGTVTDSATNAPLADATVVIDGEMDRTVTTDDDGTYSVLLTAGDYEVTASKFGYAPETATVTVAAEGTTTQDFALDPVAAVTLSGTVTDGSGYGFPLYAKVSADGTPVHTYTDPVTGEYSMELPAGTYTITVQVQYPGYQTVSEEVVVSGATVKDFAVPVDANDCLAPGYGYFVDGVIETFDGDTLPAGWEVVDYAGTGEVWRFDNPDGRDNTTGGEGNFAILDSDFYGSDGVQDSALVTPSLDFSDNASPAVGFKQDWYALGDDLADVDVSIDGGETWTTVLSQDESVRGPNEQFLQLPMAANQADVKVRFHGWKMEYDWYWEVDDVFVGTRTCEPTGEGGYVVGNVYGEESGEGVVGATVTNLDDPTETATTVATPDDENLDDGFYWIFSDDPGSHDFEAKARNYETVIENVTVVANDVVRQDFTLGSGYLEVDPTSIETTVTLGDSATEQLTVTNTGSGAADVELSEVPGDFTIQRADGSTLTSDGAADSKGSELIRNKVDTSLAASGTASSSTPANRGVHDDPWTDLADLPSALMDNRLANLDGEWYSIGGSDGTTSFPDVTRYDAAAMEWVAVAPMPTPHQAASVGAIDGQLVVASGWSDGDPTAETLVYDPAADSWTVVADNPVPVSAGGQAVSDGLLYSVGGCTTADCVPMTDAVTVYDPAADTWTQVADYPEAVAFASCGGVEGMIYCTGGNGGAGGTAASYVYDPAADAWSELPDAPSDTWASQYAAANGMLIVNGGVQGEAVTNTTFGFDVAANAWVDLPNSNTAVYRGAGACGFGKAGGSSGGFNPTPDAEYLPGYDDCGASGADVPWLSVSDYEFTVAPGESVTVDVTTDSSVVSQPGDYTAGIKVKANVPQDLPTVDVTMHVIAPKSWGKLMGTVTGQDECGSDAASPLEGALVDVEPVSDAYTGWTLSTDENGEYALWVDTRKGELEVIATHEDYRPQSENVTLTRGGTVVQDFLLRLIGCETDPEPVHPEVIRVEGSDRYATAAEISKLYEPGVDTVFVATGLDYPDALTGAARAGNVGGPVLLTRTSKLPAVTAQELARLDADHVVVLGGPASISDAVVAQVDGVTGDADVRRIAGADRYATAALISQEFGTPTTVYVTTGTNFPDALAASSRAGAFAPSYASGAPVLLVRPGSLPAATRAELERTMPDDIIIVGGESAVSAEVEAELATYGDVERVAGEDRYDTAVLLADDFDTADHVYVASGQVWPDALTGAARAGADSSPLLLTRQADIPETTWNKLDELDPGVVYVLGGEDTISPAVFEQLKTLE